MDWLNYHHLLNFWLVAREGTVQRASEVLHVTPASVSTQVKQLERALGIKLFEKKGRGLVLTAMGEEVSVYASEIFSTGRELMEMVKSRPTGRARELRVGIRDVMPKLVAYRLLEPAMKRDDSIRLVCHEAEMPELVADLAIHKLDVILTDTALDPPYRVNAYSHRLGESEVIIMGTKETKGSWSVRRAAKHPRRCSGDLRTVRSWFRCGVEGAILCGHHRTKSKASCCLGDP